MHLALKLFHIFLLSLLIQSSTSIDTIFPNRPLKDSGDVLISSEEHFALGFFSPANSKNRYIGIWYNKVSEQTVVWVANRDTPISDNSGVLSINTLGNLVLSTQNNNISVPVWSTNVSVGVGNNKNNLSAQILDTGNLVLVRNDTNGEVLWQSFDHPINTMLPFMKLGLDRRTGLNRFLTSWKSQDDPGTGTCAYRIYPDGFPQLFLHKSGAPRWRAGSWTGHRWSGVPEMTPNFIFNVSFVDDGEEITVMYGILNTSIFSRMIIDESGIMERFTWNEHERRWVGFWSAPKEPCDYYGRCGAYGICDPYHAADAFECRCFPGFEPKSPRDWYLRDGSGGCKPKRATSTCGNGEGFVKLARVKVPDTWMARANMSLSLKACKQECLKNCTCTAYAAANDGGIGCVTWHGDLVDSRTFTEAGQDFYVRVDAVELAENSNKLFGSLGKKGGVSILVVATAVILFLLVFFVYWLVKRKKRERERYRSSYSVTSSAFLEDSPSRKADDGTRNSDLPLFDLSTIAAATDNFSTANKLGQGGFGSVYMGLLFNGKEIAVKRLSKYSGQGIEEFKNEVTLIAKLQHRNLVRILGCCVEEKEKMLIYEYLPNKSLDSFIFDEVNRSLIDWSKRFEIISGIARGMLYLHQDSRLRIIHRDLKASNVLLDAAMNPKISDFGMARIFGGDQIEGSTNRVVGTYGYMSPEYAMEGKFSIKSDIYSFGVLLLEVIAGKKNSGYYPDSPNSNLIGHVWELWKEEKAGQIIDPLLGDSYPGEEVEKCIQIGLLCVQEHAMDRPTMSTIVFMLANDTALPSPKQPAFILKGNYKGGDPSTSSEGINSVNDVTVSMIEAR